jgi:hypothetical protein
VGGVRFSPCLRSTSGISPTASSSSPCRRRQGDNKLHETPPLIFHSPKGSLTNSSLMRNFPEPLLEHKDERPPRRGCREPGTEGTTFRPMVMGAGCISAHRSGARSQLRVAITMLCPMRLSSPTVIPPWSCSLHPALMKMRRPSRMFFPQPTGRGPTPAKSRLRAGIPPRGGSGRRCARRLRCGSWRGRGGG